MSSSGTTIPTVVTKAGLQPNSPATLRALLLASVAATNPGYTANLPGSLVEDVSSTEVGGLSLIDAAKVDTVNSLSPYASNELLLNQQGQMLGVQQGLPTNTSVYCVVTQTGGSGFVIPIGFTFSDGTYQYVVQDGGVTGGGGASAPLFCVASQTGSWSVPANTVTTIVTSVPSGYTLSVTNPQPGTPGVATGETSASYRARVLEAQRAVALGMPSLLRTLLGNVSGVQTRLVSVRPAATSGFWEIIVGGGDPYQVAYAIFSSLFDVTTLAGSIEDPTRDVTVTIVDYPDKYPITFVTPVQQNVQIALVWGTTYTNAVSSVAVAQVGAVALAAYVNSVPCGQPLNIYEMQSVFQLAIASLVPTQFLTAMNFTISINNVVVPPAPGTGIVAGDPEGYFSTTIDQIAIAQG